MPDTTYHVFSRCINSSDIMEGDSIKDILLGVMKDANRIYKFSLTSYVILDNHFHFIIKTAGDGPSISRIMQYIKGNFARKYNRMTGRIGPVWNERFGDTIIEASENPVRYLLWLLWYLAYNSVRKRKVWDPRSYRYNSIRAYLEEDYQDFFPVILHDYYLKLGNDTVQRVRRFLEFEDAYRKRLFT